MLKIILSFSELICLELHNRLKLLCKAIYMKEHTDHYPKNREVIRVMWVYVCMLEETQVKRKWIKTFQHQGWNRLKATGIYREYVKWVLGHADIYTLSC